MRLGLRRREEGGVEKGVVLLGLLEGRERRDELLVRGRVDGLLGMGIRRLRFRLRIVVALREDE